MTNKHRPLLSIVVVAALVILRLPDAGENRRSSLAADEQASEPVRKGFGADHEVRAPSVVVIPSKAVGEESTSRVVIRRDEKGELFFQGTISISRGRYNLWGTGAEHAFLADYDGLPVSDAKASVTMDPEFPLTFKVCKDGYAYLCGRGTLTIQGGQKYTLGEELDDDGWIAGLSSKDEVIRQGSCEAVARLGLARAVPTLNALLKDSCPEVRRNACEALAVLGGERSVEDIAGIIEDKENRVRETAAEALTRVGSGLSKEKIAGLLELLRSGKDQTERSLVVKALRAGGKSSIEMLEDSLHEAKSEAEKQVLKVALSDLRKHLAGNKYYMLCTRESKALSKCG